MISRFSAHSRHICEKQYSEIMLPLPAEQGLQKVLGVEHQGLELHSRPCIACHLLFHKL